MEHYMKPIVCPFGAQMKSEGTSHTTYYMIAIYETCRLCQNSVLDEGRHILTAHTSYQPISVNGNIIL